MTGYSEPANSKSPMQPSLHPNPTESSAFHDQTIYPDWIQQISVSEIFRLLPAALVYLEDVRLIDSLSLTAGPFPLEICGISGKSGEQEGSGP